jgi:hypothetical protein
VVEVERLRVELARKCLDLHRIDLVAAAGESLTHLEIFEIKALAPIVFTGLRHRDTSRFSDLHHDSK